MSSANEKPQTKLPSFAQKLVQSGYITIGQLQKAMIEKQKSHLPLIEILPLITGRPLPKEVVVYYRLQQLSKLKAKYGVEYLDPESETIDWTEIENLFRQVLPFEICRHYQILPLQKQESPPHVLHLAMVDPANQEILDHLRRILQDQELQFERRVIDRADYQKLVEIYHSRQEEALSGHCLPQEQDLEAIVDRSDIFEQAQSLPHLNPEMTWDVFGRIEAIEQLLQALNRELQSLKREINLNSPKASPESASPTILDQELPDLINPVLPPRDRSSDKETIVSDDPVYEELTDPGDWEQLKQEIDPNQGAIVCSDLDDPFSLEVNTSFPSVPDPWS
jgi:hypothetical protein